MSALALLRFPGEALVRGTATAWKRWKSWEELPNQHIFLQNSGDSDFWGIPAETTRRADFPDLELPVLPQHLHSTSREEYISNVVASQEAFADGRLLKTVISRILAVKKPSEFSLLKSFSRLQQQYPKAMCSLLYSQDEFCWLGASPELLLQVNNGTLRTLSLAGTRSPLHPELGNKETIEQAIVTDHIARTLEHAGLKDIRQESSIQEFGVLSHIATRFGARIEKASIGPLLHQLHPTPAVMGAPQQEALRFVKEQEQHERGLYTGLIGFKTHAAEAHIYVNLRCASVYKDHLLCFGGAGITAASDPVQEWEESGAKINAILEQLLQE